MAENRSDLEERLRAHLGRVARSEPAAGFEGRVVDAATGPRKAGLRQPIVWSRVGAMVLVAALTVLFAIVLSGHEASNVFSNISNGLNN